MKNLLHFLNEAGGEYCKQGFIPYPISARRRCLGQVIIRERERERERERGPSLSSNQCNDVHYKEANSSK
jgi:hypothetical protein